MAVNISDYDFEFRPRVKVAHPVIGSISFQDHKWANCVPGESYEVVIVVIMSCHPYQCAHDAAKCRGASTATTHRKTEAARP